MECPIHTLWHRRGGAAVGERRKAVASGAKVGSKQAMPFMHSCSLPVQKMLHLKRKMWFVYGGVWDQSHTVYSHVVYIGIFAFRHSTLNTQS